MNRPLLRFFDQGKYEIIEKSIEKTQKIGENITNIEIVNLIYSLDRPKNSKPDLPIDEKIFSDEMFNLYHRIRSDLDRCIELAQKTDSYLASFLNSYGSILNKEEQKDDVNSMDFMQKRNVLSSYLKSNSSLLENSRINTRDKLKRFTSTFYNFILDRNRYTHGTLMFEYPKLNPIIKYLNSDRKEEYAQISRITTEDYFNAYSYIMTILNNISEVIRNR